jgi:hypothetical protein
MAKRPKGRKPSVTEVLSLFSYAKQKRTPREARFDQAMRFTMPGRGAFFGSNPDTEIDEIFDETAIVAVQEFASRFQAAMTPNHSRWAELVAGSDVPPEDRLRDHSRLELRAGILRGVPRHERVDGRHRGVRR